MSSEKYLKVCGVEEIKTDVRGKKYVWVSFRPITTLANGVSVLSNQKPVKRMLEDAFEDKQGRKFPGDALFQSVENKELGLGALVEGSIRRRATSEYEIDGNKVYHYTGVVFSNEDEILQFNSKLKGKKAYCHDDDGNPTVDVEAFKRQMAVTAE